MNSVDYYFIVDYSCYCSCLHAGTDAEMLFCGDGGDWRFNFSAYDTP